MISISVLVQVTTENWHKWDFCQKGNKTLLFGHAVLVFEWRCSLNTP